MNTISAPTQFSFEELASEVHSVVEDLRWLHLELTFRNKFNEVLFQNVDSVDTFLKLALKDLRAKLGLLEASAFTHERAFIKNAFRDLDDTAFWKNENVPWIFEVEEMFRVKYHESDPLRASVLHYTVNKNPITAIIMPIVLAEEPAAVILLVLRSNTLIPRIRHFITAISMPLSVSIDYVLNVQKLRTRSRELETRVGERTAELDWTHNFLVKLVDSTKMLIMACNLQGDIIIWNKAAEEMTGIERNQMKTFDDFLSAMGMTSEHQTSMYSQIKEQFMTQSELPNFEMNLISQKSERCVISWSSTKIMTEKGPVILEFGTDVTEMYQVLERMIGYESNIENIIAKRTKHTDEFQSRLTSIIDTSGILIVEFYEDGRISFVNQKFQEIMGWKAIDFSRQTFFDTCISPDDREQVDYLFKALRDADRGRSIQGKYHVVTRTGTRLLCEWQNMIVKDFHGTADVILVFGFLIPDSDTQPLVQKEKVQFVSTSLDAKLSQRYRFLMKYVPFPLIHLDEENRIVNANPAFQELAGFDIPYGTPITDFATFEIHNQLSDPAPCNLYILNKEGLTLTHRGIITTLKIYGKTIREITLDI